MDDFDKRGPMTSPNVMQLNTPPTDAQLAEQYRQEMRAALEHVCKVMTRANRDQIDIAFQLGIDAFGQQTVMILKLSKVLQP